MLQLENPNVLLLAAMAVHVYPVPVTFEPNSNVACWPEQIGCDAGVAVPAGFGFTTKTYCLATPLQLVLPPVNAGIISYITESGVFPEFVIVIDGIVDDVCGPVI